MFKLVRFFFITSLLAAAAISVAFVLYRQDEVDRLIEVVESQNTALARSFSNSIWPRYASFVRSASKLDDDALRARPEIRKINEALKLISEKLPVLKVKIYNSEGLTVFSSEPSEIGQDKRNNPGFFAAAQHGFAASKLTYRDAISTFEGTVQHRDLVESYLPIQQGSGPVEGVFELYTDVTPVLAAAKRPANLMIALSLMLGLLYVMLFFIVVRADSVIKRQYTDIRHEIDERTQAQAALKQAHDELEQRVATRTRELTEEIVERKRAEDEARRHRDELAHFGRVSMIAEMATSLAHELNQPLTVISGCAQFCINALRSGVWTPEKLLDAMEQTGEQAERANKIVRRIRGFVHKEESERRPVDVNNVISEIADLLRSNAREYGAEVVFELARSVPPVIADPIQIQQVVLNLAHNGVEAMCDGDSETRQLCIETRASHSGFTEVGVRDRGRGMPADALEHLFDPFFTTKPQGLGMGLSISRTIVEAHGGRLWASSDAEDGTVFRFTLPVVEGSSHDRA